MRNYGTGDEPLMLVLKQPAAGEIMQVAIIRKEHAPVTYASQIDGTTRVDDGPALPMTMIKFSVKERRERVLLTNMTLARFSAVRNGQALTVTAAGELDRTFQLRDMWPLTQVMNSCVADLVKMWNIGDAGKARLKSPVGGDIRGLIQASDYPQVAIDKESMGTAEMLLLVNEQGRAADCTITGTSGIAALDSQSCAIIVKRARFKPAIGLDGKPAKGSFRQRITWRISRS